MMQLSDLDNLTWPLAHLGQGLALLGVRSGLSVKRGAPLGAPHQDAAGNDAALDNWLELAADALGVEVEPVESPYGALSSFLRGAAPALLRLLPGPGHGGGFLLLLRARGKHAYLIPPSGRVRRVPVDLIRQRLCVDLEEPLQGEFDGILDAIGIPDKRREQVKKALLQERLGPVAVGNAWLVRAAPGAGFLSQVMHSRLWRPLLLAAGAEIGRQTLFVLSWVIVGQGALQGQFEWPWLGVWALLLLSMLPFQALVSWAQQRLTLSGVSLLRQRLLHGALQLDPENVRHGGVGYFLDRVLAIESLESFVLNGGFSTLIALVQLATAAVVLYLGAGGWLHVGLLLVCVAYIGGVAWLYYRQLLIWSASHRRMTSDLVERMVGHRTRLVQEPPQRRYVDEDQLLGRYGEESRRLNRLHLLMGNSLPHGWLLLGLAGIGFALLVMQASTTALAISLGGVLLAYQALRQLVLGVSSLVRALIAWQEVRPLVQAGGDEQAAAENPTLAASLAGLGGEARTSAASPNGTQGTGPDGPGANGSEALPVLTAHHLRFRYRDGDAPLLDGLDLSVLPGEQMLLEGPSGGGKSTLARLLAGLRRPDGGLLLLHGYDPQSLGQKAWRKRVVLTPQFHENFVLTGTLAFNLLMGRRWPPGPEDLAEAEAICRELGLGDLLDRMPAGLSQLVGESGWQLSHGERSRIYVARALLQGADLLILDESFAALDPANLEQALACVRRRARAMLVIAHP